MASEEQIQNQPRQSKLYNYILFSLDYFLTRGIREGQKVTEAKRITLINRISLFGVLITLIHVLIFFYIGFYTLMFFEAIVAVLICLVILLCNYSYIVEAKILLLTLANSVLFYLSYFLGKESGIYLYFFPVIILPFILFDLNEKFKLIFFISIPILLLLTLEYINYSHLSNSGVSPEVNQIIYLFVMPCSFITIIFCVYSLIKENFVSEKKLSESESNARHIMEKAQADKIITEEINKTLAVEIEERRKIEKKLEEYSNDLQKSNKELDQFAYIVSHDLKAPLRAINNLSGWIEEDLGTNASEEIINNMHLLRGRVSRMESLIAGILEYSKIGRQMNVLEELNTSKLIYDTIDFLSPPESFTFDVQKDMPVIHTDKIKMQQIFANLIGNAIKYHHTKNGTIKIACEQEENYYKFSVTDDGPGIDSQYHQKVFGIFQTLQARDKVESTGIGLAIVQKIINEAGGTIWIESQLGRGTTFIFTWPKI